MDFPHRLLRERPFSLLVFSEGNLVSHDCYLLIVQDSFLSQSICLKANTVLLYEQNSPHVIIEKYTLPDDILLGLGMHCQPVSDAF